MGLSSMKIEIESVELNRLRESEEQLLALQACGVDNWDGYEEAMQNARGQREFRERVQDILTDIEITLLRGAYEPSEPGAGYQATEKQRAIAYEILLHEMRKV